MFHTPCSNYLDSRSLGPGQGTGYYNLQDRQRGNPRDRRSHPRVDLDLPAECQVLGTLKAFGGIAIDGSEGGLLIFSTREMSVGAVLKIIVFFPAGYELDSLEVVVEVIRRNAYQWETRMGYEYGLRIAQIEEENLNKLRWLLDSRLALEEGSREFLLELSLQA